MGRKPSSGSIQIYVQCVDSLHLIAVDHRVFRSVLFPYLPDAREFSSRQHELMATMRLQYYRCYTW